MRRVLISGLSAMLARARISRRMTLLQSLLRRFWACRCIVMGLGGEDASVGSFMILGVSAIVFGYVFLHDSHRRADGMTQSQPCIE